MVGARPGASAGYLRGERSGVLGLNMPTPQLRDRSDDVKQGWMQVNSRADDLLLNNGWIAGAVEQVVASMIGVGLRLNAKPDGSVFGWSADETSAWASNVERKFEAYCDNPYECDANGKYSMGQMQASAVRQWMATGEILAQIVDIERVGGKSRTKVKLMPSHWLAQRDDALNGVVHGVKLDVNGAPDSYLFKVKDSLGVEKEVFAKARDSFGRPNVIHIFDGAAKQVRGISIFAPVLKVARQFDQLADATLTAAMIQTIFAATVQSDYPSADIINAFQDDGEAADIQATSGSMATMLAAKIGYHDKTNIDLGRHGKIAHLMPGEELKFNRSEHPNGNYEAFSGIMLREIATALGVSFEDVSGDFRGATYSSVRMGIAKKWPITEYRRKHIPAMFMRQVYEAWLEEEIDSGRIELPGGIDAFVEHRAALTACDWRGPGKPQADDNKTAQAMETLGKLGVFSLEMMCNEYGVDWEDVLNQIARERALRLDLNIPDPLLVLSGGAGIAGFANQPKQKPQDNQDNADANAAD